MKEPKLTLPAVQKEPGYEVGYGKPPSDTRFRPGRSGNPKGRPRGSKNQKPALNEERLKDIILEEAYRSITVRDGHRNVSVPMAQAVVRSMAVNAAKGQHRAQRLFAEMLSSTERQNKALADEWLQTAIEYKVEWERELQRRDALSITDLPPPLPHPDQVIIDMNAGTARVQGPMTKEEQRELTVWIARRDDWAAELQDIEEHLRTETDPAIRKLLEDDKAHAEKLLARIDPLLEKIGC